MGKQDIVSVAHNSNSFNISCQILPCPFLRLKFEKTFNMIFTPLWKTNYVLNISVEITSLYDCYRALIRIGIIPKMIWNSILVIKTFSQKLFSYNFFCNMTRTF